MSDFQGSSRKQGALFDQQCRLILSDKGMRVSDGPEYIPELGIEIDAVITNPLTERTFWAEFKGSWRGVRPGGRRTDTMKKALANALLAHVHEHQWPDYIILSSHSPVFSSRGQAMLEVAVRSGAVLDYFCINTPLDVVRLERLLASEAAS